MYCCSSVDLFLDSSDIYNREKSAIQGEMSGAVNKTVLLILADGAEEMEAGKRLLSNFIALSLKHIIK